MAEDRAQQSWCLIFCTLNDRQDNGTNIRYEGWDNKPYFTSGA